MKEVTKYILLLLKVLTINSGYLAECPIVISRKQWGARSPTAIEYCIIPLKYVVVHHTLTPTCYNIHTCSSLLKYLQNFHMDVQGFHDIGYNFLIGGDGKVYQGVGWHKVGAHTKKFNTKSIGLAFIGNFTNKLPNRNQLKTAKTFLKCALGHGEIDRRYKLLGARTISSTQSPGLALFHEIQTWEHFAMIA